MKNLLRIILFVAVFGLAGEMDYQDACRSDPNCHYTGWLASK